MNRIDLSALYLEGVLLFIDEHNNIKLCYASETTPPIY